LKKYVIFAALGLFSIAPIWGNTNCKSLRRLYDIDNEEYFAGRLPKDTEIRAIRTKEDVLAQTSYENNHFIITYNTQYNMGQDHEHLVLYHEECHIVTWRFNTESTQHPKEWKKCMRRLKEIGAFDNILFEDFR